MYLSSKYYSRQVFTRLETYKMLQNKMYTKNHNCGQSLRFIDLLRGTLIVVYNVLIL